MENKLSLIFDMDGVLIDNDRFHHQSFYQFCQNHGMELTEQLYKEKVIGGTNEQIMVRLFEGISLEQASLLGEEKEAIYRQTYAPHLKPTNGLIKLLEEAKAKSVLCGLGTNGPFSNIDFVLDGCDIRHYFQAIANAYMVKDGKPAPDVYLKVAELLGVLPDQCIVFEDSNTGIKAAQSAGMKVVGVTSTHSREQLLPCQAYIKDFTELDWSILESL